MMFPPFADAIYHNGHSTLYNLALILSFYLICLPSNSPLTK